MSFSVSFKYFLSLLFLLSHSFLIAKTEIEGFSYRHLTTDVPQSIHIIKVDPAYFDISLARALDSGLGRENTSSISSRYKAKAAINGGFFQIGEPLDGLPKGILKIENRWFALPYKPRGALGWTKDGYETLMDRLLASFSLKIGRKEIAIDGFNRERKEGEKILYSPAFHQTTLTNSDGLEIMIKDEKISRIKRKKGNTPIPSNGWILSIGNPIETILLSLLSMNSPISVNLNIIPQSSPLKTKPDEWLKMDYIVGGAPLLVQNGKALNDFFVEKTITTFLTNRYARTAVGILKDKKWVFVVVDGEEPGLSEGMTINELAQFMVELECVEAINLDGGGSSTMIIDNKIMNTPKGDRDEASGQQGERRVSDAILILNKLAA